MKPVLILSFVFLAGLVLAGSWYYMWSTQGSSTGTLNGGTHTSLTTSPGEEVVNNVSLQLDEDGAKLPIESLIQACFGGKDCIPSIDDPSFESVAEADTWLRPEDRILILEFEGTTKLYPQNILNRHEIVNDWYPNESSDVSTAIAVTYCPLCGTGTAFERTVNGVITEFGVSGRLHNSDLVMYDRFEGSLWQQVSGEAVTGPAARRNETLEPLFLITLDWEDAKERYPEADVLARPNSFIDYSVFPYGNYETDARVNFPLENEDERLHPKAWVQGIEINGQAKAYPEELIEQQLSLTDTVGGVEVRMINQGGAYRFENLETGEEIVPLRSFWFAWAAFNPETELYTP